MEFPPLKWLVPDIVPAEGLTQVMGSPKNGKSWLMLQLALACVHGYELWTGREVAPTGVLLYALEDNPRRLKNRLTTLGAAVPTGLTIVFDCQPGNSAVVGLRQYLNDHPEINVFIIDKMDKLIGNFYINDYSDSTSKTGPLQRIAMEKGIAVIYVHHTRKGEIMDGADWTEYSNGSTGLVGTLDCQILLEKHRGTFNGRLRNEGREIENPVDLALTLQPRDGGWLLDGKTAEVMSSRSRQQIFDAISSGADTPKSVYDQMKGQGYKGTGATVRQIMGKMAAEDLLVKKDGHYMIPIKKPSTSSTPSTLENNSIKKVDAVDTVDGFYKGDSGKILQFPQGESEPEAAEELDLF
jgi:hypothetical protein